jgi:hypothetical protein
MGKNSKDAAVEEEVPRVCERVGDEECESIARSASDSSQPPFHLISRNFLNPVCAHHLLQLP